MLANISRMDVEVEEDAHGAEGCGGAFSIFSTSLCSLEVSDVGIEEAMEGGMEEGFEADAPGTLGKVENGNES